MKGKSFEETVMALRNADLCHSLREKTSDCLSALQQKETWKEFGKFLRNHFLTLSYDIGNATLYFDTALHVLQHLGFLDHAITEQEILFYVYLTFAVIMFGSTYRTYLSTIKEYFEAPSVSDCRPCSTKENYYGIKSKAAKFFGGCTSLFKAFCSSGSLFDLTYKHLKLTNPTYAAVAFISVGNLFANLSIFNRPEKKRRRQVIGEGEEQMLFIDYGSASIQEDDVEEEHRGRRCC